jgi:hypothetical protein
VDTTVSEEHISILRAEDGGMDYIAQQPKRPLCTYTSLLPVAKSAEKV